MLVSIAGFGRYAVLVRRREADAEGGFEATSLGSADELIGSLSLTLLFLVNPATFSSLPTPELDVLVCASAAEDATATLLIAEVTPAAQSFISTSSSFARGWREGGSRSPPSTTEDLFDSRPVTGRSSKALDGFDRICESTDSTARSRCEADGFRDSPELLASRSLSGLFSTIPALGSS